MKAKIEDQSHAYLILTNTPNKKFKNSGVLKIYALNNNNNNKHSSLLNSHIKKIY